MFRSNVAHVHPFLARINQGKHAIVWRYKMMAVARRNDRPPCSTHARVDHNHVYGPGREVGIGLRDAEPSIEHIKGLNRVADIDDRGIGRNIEDDALHGANEVIVNPEISGQCDDRTLWQASLTRKKDRILPTNVKLICGGARRQGTEVMIEAEFHTQSKTSAL